MFLHFAKFVSLTCSLETHSATLAIAYCRVQLIRWCFVGDWSWWSTKPSSYHHRARLFAVLYPIKWLGLQTRLCGVSFFIMNPCYSTSFLRLMIHNICTGTPLPNSYKIYFQFTIQTKNGHNVGHISFGWSHHQFHMFAVLQSYEIYMSPTTIFSGI